MLIIAHRGASAYELENSPSAFRLAWEQGADMIELDLHRAKDDQLIVMHDAELHRTSTGKGAIQQLSLSEIQQFRLTNGEPIPTFEDVYEGSIGQGNLYIELKGEHTEEPLVAFLKDRKKFPATEKIALDQIIVGSSDPARLKKIKAFDARIQTSLMFNREKGTYLCLTPRSDEIISLTLEVGADFVHVCWEKCLNPAQLLTPHFIELAVEKGLDVVIWHEERDEELKEIMEINDLFGICTDTPDKVRNYLHREEAPARQHSELQETLQR